MSRGRQVESQTLELTLCTVAAADMAVNMQKTTWKDVVKDSVGNIEVQQ